MDLSDICSLAALGPLVLLLVYLLAILLRLACHFTAVEIPALGRAYFTTGMMVALTGVPAFYLLGRFDNRTLARTPTRSILVSLLVVLAANCLISIGLYRVLLPVRTGQAWTLWLWQVALFVLLAVLLTGCVGLPLQLLAR